jgi:hypothetical protein
MDNIIEIKSKRFKFLNTIYEVTGGDESSFVNMWDVGEELHYSRKDTDLIVKYLVGENLVKFMAVGGGISITHWGVRQVEEALTEPDQSTAYFPAVNIINVNNMIGSQIQQCTNNSTQTAALSNLDMDKAIGVIEEITKNISNLNINNADKNELSAEIATIRAQMLSIRPKDFIIKESLKTIRNILEGLTGSILATELLNKLSSIMQ